MENLFITAKAKGEKVGVGRRKSAAKIINASIVKNKSKNSARKARKKVRKAQEIERIETEKLVLIKKEEDDKYNSLDLFKGLKSLITIEENITVRGNVNDVIKTLADLKKKYSNAITIEIDEFWTGYEDMHMIARIGREETNVEYRDRIESEKAERNYKAIIEKAKKAEEKRKNEEEIKNLEERIRFLRKRK